MYLTTTLDTPATTRAARPLPWLMRRLLGRVLAQLPCGSLTLVLPDGRQHHHAGPETGPHGQITLHRWRALRRMMLRGDLGLAEGYIAGDWSSADLTALIALAAVNARAFDATMDGHLATRLTRRLVHMARGNTTRGSRRNIAFHYDMGNDFYRLWLDDSMTYSSALAIAPGQSLEAAQAAKLARVAELLAPAPGDRVLEIGCGWGALAAHLAPVCAGVTGITLSQEQLAFAQQRIARQGLADTVALRLQDYRDVTETYERIVSIEMLEAVGEAWWPTYFAQVAARLKPGGKAVLQVITIAEDRYEHYRATPDFIQHYIFPGGMLPTASIIAGQARGAGLRLAQQEHFGQGYAATLAEWRRRFHAQWDKIAALGFEERFRRLWDYYLCYCEAGFSVGAIDVGLYVLEKPA